MRGTRHFVDSKTMRLLHGLAAVGVTYCRIRQKGITVIPATRRVKEDAKQVINALHPEYEADLKAGKYHGFRIGEYEAIKATGELRLIKK